MIYLFAGHSSAKGQPNYDPGAVSNGVTEADLTTELRNLISDILKVSGSEIKVDDDRQSLIQVINSTHSSEKDVVCDLHFNAATPSATGVEVLIPDRHTVQEYDIARDLADQISKAIGIRNRGVKTEAESHHGKLGIMRPQGINILIEVCFITNLVDLNSYRTHKNVVADIIAKQLIKADAIFK